MSAAGFERGAARRGKPLSGATLQRAGLGAIDVPAGGCAIYLSVRVSASQGPLFCTATDEDGGILARTAALGQGERRLARLPIPSGRARRLEIGLRDDQGSASAQILDVRVEVRSNTDAFALQHWRENAGRWRGEVLEIVHTGELLASPEITSETPISGAVALEAWSDGPVVLGLWIRDLEKQTIAAGRYWLADGPVRCVTPFRNLPPGRYGASLVAQYVLGAGRPALRAVDAAVDLRHAPAWSEDHSTYLPHWGKLKRFIHRACKRSSSLNGFVQGIEFRLNRQELLSMPRYMSFCPTGQCNALCDFCSVTINRTGIVKKQVDGELIERFTQPVRRTVAMYGLEGNGEPTLHRGFPDLVRELTAGESEAYLITNGSRFSEDLLPALLRLESVNVSLNAATPETHRTVMKLKEHDIVVDGLRRIVQTRGFNDPALQSPANPRVSVSFVATRQNAHEVEQFLTLAEDQIGADVAFIRPLSELGNEFGTVEDLRGIVPYASDVQDLTDAVEDYNAQMRRRLDIRFDKNAFRSVRPDPLDHVARPPGFENRLLAPRQRHWSTTGSHVALSWRLATTHVRGAPADGDIWEAVSAPIPTTPNESVVFALDPIVRSGSIEFVIEGDEPEDVVWRETIACGHGGALRASLNVGQRRALKLRLRVTSGIDASLDFGRLRTPVWPVETSEATLRAVRWEVGGAHVDADIGETAARVRYRGASGPYLLKSYAIPTQPGSRLRVELQTAVRTGALGVGLLSADQTRWLTAQSSTGGHVVLEATTGQDTAFRLVAYACAEGELDADIDLSQANLSNSPLEEDAAAVPPPLTSTLAEPDLDSAPPTEPTHDPAPTQPRLVKIDTSDTRQRKVFCHKPWSDLHNFTVDGRMDVCCIATGPSQERYGLGNLRTQDFQEVWNGETAKLFRRTVNSDAVLPPCARCPMGYAYQGMWFDPNHTLARVEGWIWDQKLFKLPLLRRLPPLLLPAIKSLVRGLAFSRFR